MIKLFITSTACLLLFFCSSVFALPYMIWNPIESPSGDSLHRVLQSTQISGIEVSDISPYLDQLHNYKPLFIISEYCDPVYGNRHIPDSILAAVQYDLLDYLNGGGALYWEGVSFISMNNFYRLNILGGFDIATCVPPWFDGITSCNDDFGSTIFVSTRWSAAPIIGFTGQCAFHVSAAGDCITTSLAFEQPFRVLLTSFYFEIMNDNGASSRADYLQAVLNWLNAMGIDENRTILPSYFSAIKCYPNPFNSSTVFSYSLSRDSRVELVVYDILGQKVMTLCHEFQPAGEHSFIWDGSAFPSGPYFARLVAGENYRTQKLMLLR